MVSNNYSNSNRNVLDSSGLYCAYIRKSRDDMELERTGDYDILKRHRETLLDLSKRYGVVISKFYEEVISGDSIDARPEMCALLRDVDAGMWDGVFVMEVERLARGDTIDQGRVSRSFQYSDTLIITPMKTYDPRDEYDEEYFEFSLFMSRKEYKTIKRRLQRGRLRSVQDGKYVGNIAPYGYKRARLENDTGFTLEQIPEEAAIVALIFNLYVYGDGESSIRYGMQRIADYLNKRSIRPRISEKWTLSSVKDILSNPVYYGYLRWNHRKAVRKIVDGEIDTSRPLNHDCELYLGLHKPIITEELFKMAEKIRISNPCVPVGQHHTQKNPFAGLIFCSECGKPMQRKAYNVSGKACSFICPTRGCPTVSDYLDNVEKEVINSLRSLYDSYKYHLKPEQLNTSSLENKHSLLQIKEQELAEINKRRNGLFDFLERGIYTEDVFKERMAKIEKELDAAASALEQLTSDYNALSARLHEQSEFIPKCRALLENYDFLSPAEKNALYKELIEKMVYTKTRRSNRGNLDEILFALDIYPKIKPV